jgi:hypothetical protein
MTTFARDLLGWFRLDGFREYCGFKQIDRALSSVIFLCREINRLGGEGPHQSPPFAKASGGASFSRGEATTFTKRFLPLWGRWIAQSARRMRSLPAPPQKNIPRVSLTFTILRQGETWLVNG